VSGGGFRRWPRAPASPDPAPVPPGAWRRRLPAILVLLTATIVLAAPGPLSRAQMEAGQTFGADSYTRIVNEGFAPLNWLVRVADPRTGAPLVALSRDAQRQPEVMRFVRGSYLGQDLASSDPELWQFDGNRVRGINPNAHNLLDPFAWRGRWEGNLMFRGDGSSADSRRMVSLITSRNTEIPLSPRYREEPEGGVMHVASGEVTGDASRGLDFWDPEDRPLATLRMIGSRPIIIIRCNASRTHDVTISTAAYSLRSCHPAGAGGGAETVTYPLLDEDRITFRQRANPRPVLTLELAYGRSLISRYRPFGPRLPSTMGGNLARDIARAMDWSVGRLGRRGALARMNVELTLDRDIQAKAETVLTEYSNGLLERLGRDRDDLFPAAVTVMDATNGELLALASFPNAERLAGRWDAQTSSLARNQNLVALPIGSAAKVPIAAAILSRFPGLRNLCISGTQADEAGKFRIHEILGMRLRDPIGDTVAGGDVDFDRFLRNSSNRFGAALIALAAARVDPVADRAGGFVPRSARPLWPLAPLDGFSIRGAGQACPGVARQINAPSYIFQPLPGAPGATARPYLVPPRLPNLIRDAQDGRSWIDWLRHLFNLEAAAGDPRPTIYDPTIWRPLVGNGSDRQVERHFAGISPDRENFGLSTVPEIREYLMVMLGGGNARWTAIKLAESYARIVMAREINARITFGEGQPDSRLRFVPIPAIARETLLSGMRQVGRPAGPGQPHGTAPALEAARLSLPAGDGQEIRIFAKTGTPTLEEPIRSTLNRLMNRLIENGILIIDSEAKLDVGGLRGGEAPADALRRLTADRRLDYDPASAPRLLAQIGRINRLRRFGHDGGLMFDSLDRLTGIRPDGLRRRPAEAEEGGVLAMVIGRYCTSDVRSLTPKRALSIVVNVQARTAQGGPGSERSGPNPAVAIATGLLAPNGALATWLASDPRGTAQCRR
jgi:hypothetical protein